MVSIHYKTPSDTERQAIPDRYDKDEALTRTQRNTENQTRQNLVCFETYKF